MQRPVCASRNADEAFRRWWEFRNDELADAYGRLCATARRAGRGARCLLHLGEFFGTADLASGNPAFALANVDAVTDLVIVRGVPSAVRRSRPASAAQVVDSNMALLGAPSSPSIVGLLVATVKRLNKTVHFEAATAESKFVFEAPYLAQIGIVRADSLTGAHLDTRS